MSHEEVATFLLFARADDAALGDASGALADGGWSLERRDGEYVYRVEEGYERSVSIDTVVTDLNETYEGSVSLERDGVSLSLQSNTDLLPTISTPNIVLTGQRSDLKYGENGVSHEAATARVETYVAGVETVVRALGPDYGFGQQSDAVASVTVPSRDELYDGIVYKVFWLNVFSPTTVERVGRKRLSRLPAWRTTEFDSGHVCLVTSDNPVQPSTEWTETGIEDDLGEILELETYWDRRREVHGP